MIEDSFWQRRVIEALEICKFLTMQVYPKTKDNYKCFCLLKTALIGGRII